jgi:signal peptidase II
MIIGLFISLLAVVGLVGLDLLIKHWAVTELAPVGSMELPIFGNTDIIGLYYTENTGAAFSFFSGSKYFLIIFVSILLLSVAVYGIFDKNKHILKSACLIMIFSGGLGNLLDRIRNGFVVDYIEFRFMDFAIFNFADILVTVGAFLLIIYIWSSEMKSGSRKSRRKRRAGFSKEVSKYKNR